MFEEKILTGDEMVGDDKMASESEYTPFYYTKGWVAVWCILIWPIGIVMLWNYFEKMQNDKMPRTRLLKEENIKYQ